MKKKKNDVEGNSFLFDRELKLENIRYGLALTTVTFETKHACRGEYLYLPNCTYRDTQFCPLL